MPHVQVVKDLGVLFQGVGEGRASLDRRLDVQEDTLELGLLLLRSQDVQALDQRETRVYHSCELAAEYDQVLCLDLFA
jgi:hypothetical protein